MMAKKSHYYSYLLHKVELATLRGFGLSPSNKTLFTASLVVWMKAASFVWWWPRCSLSHTSVSIPCTCPFRMVLAWRDLWERDLVFFFKACEATFFMVMTSLKKMLFGLGSLAFGERYERLDYPTECAKICNHEFVNKSNLYRIPKNFGYNL